MYFKPSSTGMLSPTTKAFVEREDSLISLLGPEHPYWNLPKAIELKQNFSQDKRQVLADTLYSEYTAIAGSDSVNAKVFENIEKLRNSNTFTVTTGQQLHLFIGPAFVIYKILSLVDHCELFQSQHPDKDFVPVYWMASEDHDFEEIQNTHLFKKSFEWNALSGGACGRIKTDTVMDVIGRIKQDVQLDQRQTAMLDEMANIYATSKNLSEATRRIINRYFGEYGVIVMEADRAVFKKSFLSVLYKDIVEGKNHDTFTASSRQLEQAGLSTQLNVRPVNVFYLGENLRSRILREDRRYLVKDTDIVWTEEELKVAMDEHPENFSPNALLRPLYQETILPNVAYIGGNAEVTYWIQLHKTMSDNGLSHPALILRPSVWITPTKVSQWLEKRGIKASDLLITKTASELLSLVDSETLTLASEIDAFIKLREQIQNTVAQHISKDLKAIVEAGKQYEKALKSSEKSLKDYQIEKNAKEMDKLEEIRSIYFNINNIQERKTDSLELLIKHENVVFSIKSALRLDNSFSWLINL